MAEIPHLAWPFRMGGKTLKQVEQDSLEDVQQNVLSYLHTERGERPLSPDVGLEDPTFGPGVNVAQLSADIEDAEPRAIVEITATPFEGPGRTQVNVNVELADDD